MMNKNDKIEIFGLYYKIYHDIIDDEFHTPLHVGKELRKNIYICDLCDNIGDNISEHNRNYWELTGVYWIWKNIHNKQYIGHEHYRRRWNIDFNKIPDIINKYKIIVPNIEYVQGSVREQYINCHSDLIDKMKEVIIDKHPEYIESWDKFIVNSNKFYKCNCFITSVEEYDKICTFIFTVLNELSIKMGFSDSKSIRNYVEKNCKINCPDYHKNDNMNWIDYQECVYGFLSERLLTMYFQHNYPNRYECELKNIN